MKHEIRTNIINVDVFACVFVRLTRQNWEMNWLDFESGNS